MTAPTDRHIQRCPVGCDAPLVPTDILRPQGALLRCAACGQLVSQISEAAYWESMRAFNSPAFNRPSEREAARRFAVARRRLERTAALVGRAPADMRLLDVGCSRGEFVAAAARLGFRAEGVEPAPDVAADARAQGLKVHTGLLEEQHFPAGSFDAVTLFEVIEHLRDPLALLTECRRTLAPGGALLLSTGNGASWTARRMQGRWDYFSIEKDAGHVSFFNPRSLALAGERAGLSLARIETRQFRFHERGDVPAPLYAIGKLAAKPVALLAQATGHGQDMLAWLRPAR